MGLQYVFLDLIDSVDLIQQTKSTGFRTVVFPMTAFAWVSMTFETLKRLQKSHRKTQQKPWPMEPDECQPWCHRENGGTLQ